MKKLLPLFSCFTVCAIFSLHSAQAQAPSKAPLKVIASPLPPDKTSKLSGPLKEFSDQNNNKSFRALAARKPSYPNQMTKEIQVIGNKVVLDITVRKDIASARAELAKFGFTETGAFGRKISGLMPISALPQLESISSIRYAAAAYKPHHQSLAGNPAWQAWLAKKKPVPVVTQGDTAQRSYLARKWYNVSGKGVKLGIISDSWNNLGTAADGIKHGELPGPGNPFGYTKPVQILQENTGGGGTDEGRMMLELVHDVAPGADLAFHTGNLGEANFAEAFQQLAQVGCKVVADDLHYFDEPFFQDGIVSQSIDLVKASGTTVFTAAGNSGIQSYESSYRPTDAEILGPGNGTAHNFAAPGDPPVYFQPLIVPVGGTFIATLQWDQPFFSAGGKGAESDFDIYVIDETGNIVADGIDPNIQTGDPVEVTGFQNLSTSTNFFVFILKYDGPDVKTLKYVSFQDGSFVKTHPAIPGQGGPTIIGHSNAAGAITTGAAWFAETPPYGVKTARIEPYSSYGGVPIYFDVAGERISPVVRKKPDLTAPDGGNIYYLDPAFGNQDIKYDTDTFPNFFGTSAAAPHAAAVAALMIEAEKLGRLTPEQIRGVMTENTSQMDDPYLSGFEKGFDFASGAGFLKADGAVGDVKFPHLYLKNLKLTALCSDHPGVTRNWKIWNPNPFPVDLGYYVAGSQQSGKFSTPSGDTTFETPTYSASPYFPVPNVLIIDWQDNFGFTRTDIAFSASNKCGVNKGYGVKEDAVNGESTAETEEQAILSNKVEVFPNPSRSSFRVYLSLVASGPMEMELYGIDGRKLQSRTVVQTNGVIDLDASSYRPGMYILKVKQGNFNKTFKLIRQ